MTSQQSELLDLLIAFDGIAKEHHISYQLAYGTLLGAVRHKGFIPWDDDIDIIVPSDQYALLVKTMHQYAGDFILQEMSSDPSYFYPFAKFKRKNQLEPMTEEDIRFRRPYGGAWIDVFPLIPIEDVESLRFKRWWNKRLRLTRILALKALPLANASFPKRVAKIPAFFMPRKSLIRCFEHSTKHFDSNGTMSFIQDFWSNPSRMVFDRSLFSTTTDLSFEGSFFPCPERYSELLELWYGDYMTLPPVDQRNSHFH